MNEESITNQNQSHPTAEEQANGNWREHLNSSLEQLFLKSGYDAKKMMSERAVGSMRKKTHDGSEVTIWRIQPWSNNLLPLPRWTFQVKSSNRFAVSSNGEIEPPELLRRYELRSNEAGIYLYRLITNSNEVMASDAEGAEVQHFVDELDDLVSSAS